MMPESKIKNTSQRLSKIKFFKTFNSPITIHQSPFTNHGFTLIELIIVAAILGLLATFITITFPASQGRARDTVRRTDLKQYQTAVELYANRNNGLYPISGATLPASLCGAGNPLSWLTTCPNDPKNGSSDCGGPCLYQYVGSGLGYGLWARLERPADSTKPYFITCSNGLAGEATTPPSSGDVCGSLD